MSTYASRAIVRPLTEMTEIASSITSGDLQQRVPEHGRHDEMAVLGEAFHTMVNRLISSQQQTEEANTKLEDLNVHLKMSVAELQRSNADLEQFAYVASHVLQAPLRHISAYVKILEEEQIETLSPEAEEATRFILEGVDRMNDLIKGLLEFSRVGRREEGFSEVHLSDAMKGALEKLDDIVKESQATVEISDLPKVYGNRGLLEQLFQNLLENSIKYCKVITPFGTVEVSI